MKIALLMPVASPWSRDIAEEILRAGHEVHVIDVRNSGEPSYLKRSDSFQRGGIGAFERCASEIHDLEYSNSGFTGLLGFASRLSKILRAVKPDVVFTLYGGTFAAACYLSRFRPYLVYVVGSDILVGGRLKRYISRVSLTAASSVISNGQSLAKRTREVAPRARVVPVYIGTDASRFRAGERVAAPISIVCTRGFLPIYNNELLIRALKHLPEDLPEYEVTFAAAGPELEKARALADEILPAAQRERVKFLGGASRETLAELLSKAHIYVSVSLSDGTSLSLMEAMACGAFPVLSDIPANREWVEPTEKNGLLVSCDDEAGLAEALAKAMQDEALRAAAGTKNRQLILERADLRANMQKVVQELVGCVEEYRRPASAVSSSRLPVE
jgi:glycosyltransferase involved in cell wall biosynthesis